MVSAKNVRLVHVVGPWQLIVASAALSASRRRHCADVLLYEGPPFGGKDREILTKACDALWEWDDKRFADGSAEWKEITSNIDGVSEIWIGKLFGRSEKRLLSAFSGCRVTVYEDGLHSYIPVEITCGWGYEKNLPLTKNIKRWLGSLAHVVGYNRCTRGSGICLRDQKRLKGFFHVLGDVLDLPPYLEDGKANLLSTEKMKNRISLLAVGAGLVVEPLPEDERAALFVGQCFARWRMMSREAELALYTEAAQILIDCGYRVYWKEHPRESSPFYDELSLLFGEDIAVFRMDPPWFPLEAAFLDNGADLCVSATSTSLFYLRKLFDTPVFTVADNIEGEISPEMESMRSLVMQHFPVLERDRLLELSRSTNLG